MVAINSADDERNPPETGIMERELMRLRNARLFLIPPSEDTSCARHTELAPVGNRFGGVVAVLESVPVTRRCTRG